MTGEDQLPRQIVYPFIGGPRDGELFGVPPNSQGLPMAVFQVYAEEPASPSEGLGLGSPPAEIATYVREVIVIGDRLFYYRAEKMMPSTARDAFLLSCYRILVRSLQPGENH